MKNLITLLTLFILVVKVSAQDDLLNMIDKETPQKTTPVYATFKSSRIVNLQSNENMKAKHLDFRIQHRFTALDFGSNNNYGFYNMLGLDGAVLRLSFDYGITDKLMIGVGRNTIGKTYDGYLKYQIMQQKTKGKNSFPIGITYYGNMAVNTLEFYIAVELKISVPGMDKAAVQALVEKTHKVCPYSNATRGNIDVTLTVV